MYLKKYDLSRISDDRCKVCALLATNQWNSKNVDRITRHTDFIHVKLGYHTFTIRDNGDMSVGYCREERIPKDLSRIYHLLMETQWRDPEVELPKDENEKVIIKYSDDGNIFIITGFIWKTNKRYLSVGSTEDELFNTEYDKINIIGWLPIENVIL